MSTINKITSTRALIDRAIKDLKAKLCFQTVEIECDLNESCMVFVDLECRECGLYRELEIVSVEIPRYRSGRETDHSYPNIVDYIGKALGVEIKRMNEDEYQSFLDDRDESGYTNYFV